MKTYRLKKSAFIAIMLAITAVTVIGALSYGVIISLSPGEGNFNFINDTAFDNSLPVFQGEEEKKNEDNLIKPFIDEEVKVLRSFYDYKSEADKQESSIYIQGETYMQNEGIDFGKKDLFGVIAVYNGVVTDVTNDKTLGNIITIKHSSDVVSVYRSLSEVSVKVNDTVTKGQEIGKSGNSNISPELENHVHFELIIKNVKVNPEEYFNKPLAE